ncbi:MAG: hypothetical protein HOA57_03845 [Candidatus Magasanikbacteria bacterium]|jgi:hypothetical protein|nr:hypothetical protein [Candidatus Magasanikbacteria bacterium]MBT4315145.1 hypothetical protein [Candidatus Magasanikbacteria bacterium]MBT4547399.1 hypothetical protein [Candidatus Magasanikbacteria bacterium]MBT6819480.1 hypothetical protein [Candidatus Magasanikbacteria bacterium]
MFKRGKKTKLERYEDVTGEFTSSELKWGEWYVRHKILLRKIVIGVLLAWSTITLGYGLGYFTYYFSYGYFQDQNMATQQLLELSNLKNTRELFQAEDLQIGSVEVYNSVSEELYDFVARASNPNDRWIAIVSYKFSFSGGETDLAQTVLLPGAQRPLVHFGFDVGGYPANPTLVIEDVKWKSVSAHAIKDVSGFIADRSDFLVENFEFTRASRSQGVLNHMIEFDILNNTAYNYWEPTFYIELIKGSRTAGIIYFVSSEFKSQEERHVDLRSYIKNLEVSNIKVWPVVNVFDNSQYMSVGL